MYYKFKQWKRLLSFIFFVASGIITHAQSVAKIKGAVTTDETGELLIKVAVTAHEQGSNAEQHTMTDVNGLFVFNNLVAGHKYDFTFTYTGYEIYIVKDYMVNADNNNSLLVKMTQKVNQMEDVVIVGYGTQKKINLTGAVTQVGGEVLENKSLPNVTQGLQGMIPNLNLIMGDGKPIQSPVYNVRGNPSIGQGGNALVLIDGVQGDPSLLNPNDIASVTVLKDASSAAVYGARAAYGVVLITTKSPKKGSASITYSSDYASKKPTVVPDIVSNGYQYALMFDSAWSSWNNGQIPQNINKTQPFSMAYLAALKQHNDDPSLPKAAVDPTTGNYVYYGNTNWYDLLYKKNLGAMSQNLSVSGSTDKASYYVSGRYYNQKGLFRYNSDNYNMYNLTAKGSVQATPWLLITNSTWFDSRFYHNPLNVGEGGGIWRNMADNSQPSSVMFNPDGTLTASAAYGVGDFWYGKNGIDMRTQEIKNTSAFTATFLNDHFHIKGDLTFQNLRLNQDQIRVQLPYSLAPGVISYLGTNYNDISATRQTTNYLATNLYADYDHTFEKDHYFKILLGYNYEQSVYNNISVTRNGLVYGDAKDLSLATGNNISTSGGYEKWAILGGFGRINYAFRDKYLLELDARYDGSSKFPHDQTYGFFPSASAGWNISKEAFWHVSPKFISNLKIRGSYGSLGNGNISSYQYEELFSISKSSRVLNGTQPQYTSVPGLIPDGLTWETATTADIGLDLSMLSNRLDFTGDIYRRKTSNMYVVGPTYPAVLGTGSPKGNFAGMRTNGWEANISWKDQFSLSNKAFHYNIGFWMSDYISTITKYIGNSTGLLSDYYPGEKLGEIWGYVDDGYWTADNVAQAKAFQPLVKSTNNGTWLPGDIKFKDLNGDGVINNGSNTLSDHGDTKIIGNSTPRYQFGFNLGGDWDNFFISAFFQGVLKQNWYPGSEADAFWGQYNRPYNYLMKSQLGNIWSPTNTDAYFPRYSGYVAQNGSGELAVNQTKYLQSVRYIRLKNIQVGYNFPKSFFKKIPISNARLYVSGDNLWTASPFYKHTKALDVENIGKSDVVLTGSSNNGNGNNYPILKSYTVGVLVNF
ncbi:MAG: SusC/RagA family TonB-linked outer membrane protein [Arachidicoccus sp.]|nr:SusC/RagA family TonB-linked outer membrane protein [Arachidicoccus sp.]